MPRLVPVVKNDVKGERQPSVDLAGGTRIVFDVAITTSAGTILLEDQRATYFPEETVRLMPTPYLMELNALAKSRSMHKETETSNKEMQSDAASPRR